MAAIEMAFVFPSMLVLYFGLVDVSNLLSANRKVTLAASTIADLVTQAPGTITKDDLTGFINAAGPIMDPFPVGSTGFTVTGWQRNGTTVAQRWQFSSGSTTCGNSNVTGLDQLTEDGNDVVVARVCYTWLPILGKVIGSSPITLDDELVLRPRQSTTIVCKDC